MSAARTATIFGAMFGIKVAITLLLMGSIPMWIRLIDASSVVIGIVRLGFGVSLTVLLLRPSLSTPITVRGPVPRWLSTRSVLIMIGVFFFGHWVTYFEAIQRSSATLGILALSTYGIHVTWLGALFSPRRPTRLEWASVLASTCGAWICLPRSSADPGAAVGFALGLLSGMFYAALPILHQRVIHVPLATRGLYQFLVALVLFLPLAPFQNWQISGQSWGALVVLGVACTFIAHNLWISITSCVRPATAGVLYFLAIPVTMVLETVVLKKSPNLVQIGGAVLVVAGGVVALLARPGPEHPAQGET